MNRNEPKEGSYLQTGGKGGTNKEVTGQIGTQKEKQGKQRPDQKSLGVSKICAFDSCMKASQGIGENFERTTHVDMFWMQGSLMY